MRIRPCVDRNRVAWPSNSVGKFPSPMRIGPCVDMALTQCVHTVGNVSIPYEDWALCRLDEEHDCSKCASVSIPYEDWALCRPFEQTVARLTEQVSIPYEDWALCRHTNEWPDSKGSHKFPSPMRIGPCVDSASHSAGERCTSGPISKRPTSPQAAKKHSSTPKRESRIALPDEY